MNVVILGASDRPDRYSYRAQRMLMEAGHRVFPLSLDGKPVLGEPGYTRFDELPAASRIDTVTVYLRPELQPDLIDDLVDLKPRRVIFNPGSESAESKSKLGEAGIDTVEACTMVMLRTGQF